ncbi:hypothetical protein PoB_001377700 [Plakobranchus ocellatus]|uniref:Uncharacterized protein n=1 Tax=Plakobranchus ocellatus TaxID=259542 RepID=A0AAV3YWB3_9GAST|nr:hypothetical protein PoB_001377700 [Plakobranchus ocellatus]
MLRDGMMLMVAGVYDGQNSRSNLMYWQLVQSARLLQGDPRLQGPTYSKAGTHGRNVSVDFRASSPAIEPPTSHIVWESELNLNDHETVYKHKTLVLLTSAMTNTTARSHAGKRANIDMYALL